MPQLVPILFSVPNDGSETFVPLEELNANKKYPAGIYIGEGPGVGEMMAIKIPCNNILSFTDDIRREYTESKNSAIKALYNYVQINKTDRASLDEILEKLFISEIDEVLVPQLIFISAHYSTIERKKMLDLLFDTGKIEALPIIAMLVQRRKPQLFALAHDILGSRYTEYMIQGKYPFEFSFVTGSYTNEAANILCNLWQSGISANRKHYRHGTLLHTIVTNEQQDYAITLMQQMSAKRIPYDFASVDSEGKTLLILACKLKLHKLVKFLCYQHLIGRNIGLDIKDNDGRRAIQYAAALGASDSFRELVDVGANRDGIDEYLTAEPDLVASILKSIHVEPDRHYKAPHNWLYCNDSLRRPVTQNSSLDQHKRVLISLQGEHAEVLRCALRESFAQKDKFALFKYQMSQLGSIINSEAFRSAEDTPQDAINNFLLWVISESPRQLPQTLSVAKLSIAEREKVAQEWSQSSTNRLRLTGS